MDREAREKGRRGSGAAAWVAGGLLLFGSLVLHVRFSGHFEGVFVLRSDRAVVEVADDLLPPDRSRVLFEFVLEPLYAVFDPHFQRPLGFAYVQCEWDAEEGTGFFASHRPDGTKFFVSLSRFSDSSGLFPHGLVVGGGVPLSLGTGELGPGEQWNETGVAFFDGHRWLHLWCNANETLIPEAAQDRQFAPSNWRYTGGGVLKKTEGELVLASSHELVLQGVPLQIDKFLFHSAHETYFILATRITNRSGTAPAVYYYLYGDEPWVGEYGSSAGDVGWLRGGLVQSEGNFDTRANSFAGMWDRGNRLVGERGAFTGAANFIEWLGENGPDLGFFANEVPFRPTGAEIPLVSPESRWLDLQWGPHRLEPGSSKLYVVAIGMAALDPRRDLPVKPKVSLPADFYAVLGVEPPEGRAARP